MSQQVLVTGSAGTIGQAACKALAAAGHRVRGFDRSASPQSAGLDDAVVADLTDREAVEQAMVGVQSVVHLAAVPSDAPFVEQLVGPNVIGLFHVMDAARQAGVQRVVLASSCQAVGRLLQTHDGPLSADTPPAPNNHYGLTKVWAEQMGEMYARCWGLSVIATRIGWLPRRLMNPDTVREDSIIHDLYLSPDDAGRFFTCAVEAEGVDFAILYACGPGRPGQPCVDLEPSRRLIGYEPRDRWPTGLPAHHWQ